MGQFSLKSMYCTNISICIKSLFTWYFISNIALISEWNRYYAFNGKQQQHSTESVGSLEVVEQRVARNTQVLHTHSLTVQKILIIYNNFAGKL